MKNKYGINIYWSDEDQLYIVEVPELPGCVTHGDTQSAALRNAKEAIQLWVKTAKEFGNPVPEPRGQRAFAPRDETPRSQPAGRRRPVATFPIRRKNQSREYYDAATFELIKNPNAR
jgi:predicted RNase H-like HicB family nuclease